MNGFWFLLVLVSVARSERLFTGDQVIRVDAQSEEQIKLLQILESEEEWNLDFWRHPVSTELPVDVRVPRSHLGAVKEYLNAHSIPFTVMIDDVQELLDQEKAEMRENHIRQRKTGNFDFGAYHPLETIYSWMDTLVAQHPNLVTKLEIGKSYEKRPMYVLKFSTGGTNRPAIWMDLGIHSREWVSQATGVWTANKIATDYGTDASLTSVLKTMDIYMLIVANPDGYVFSHTKDRMWRKTRSSNSGSVCVGTDPNRNWDAGFGGPGSSTYPCSETYQGPFAHSEIEVKNIVNLIQSHGNFKSFISVHAYSQLLMYPYGYTCRGSADQAELDSVARAAVQKLTSLYGTRYKVGSICNIICMKCFGCGQEGHVIKMCPDRAGPAPPGSAKQQAAAEQVGDPPGESRAAEEPAAAAEKPAAAAGKPAAAAGKPAPAVEEPVAAAEEAVEAAEEPAVVVEEPAAGELERDQASGGSIDWSYDVGIKYSFAFELRDTGRYGFILPANQIIPTASETWLALKHIMEYVRDHPY